MSTPDSGVLAVLAELRAVGVEIEPNGARVQILNISRLTNQHRALIARHRGRLYAHFGATPPSKPFDAPSAVPGPTGKRHPTSFLSSVERKMSDFGRITEEETSHLLASYLEYLAFLTGNRSETREEAFWSLMASEDNLLEGRPARKKIPPKIRFEAFREANFTCQYCGAQAPDVKLNVDHILPVARGGSNHASNLAVACEDCNFGKGARGVRPEDA